MPQVTVYMAAGLIGTVKLQAKRARVSVSAYLASLVQRDTTTPTWPDEFLASFGAWKGADIDVPEQLPFERRAKLK